MNLSPQAACATGLLWPGAGYGHLRPDPAGRLPLSDDYLRHLYRRPELAPVAESCGRERALHRSLLAQPRRSVGDAELTALADPDGRENYRLMLAFRDRLLAHPNLETAYLALVDPADKPALPVPPALLDMLTQTLTRHVLSAATLDRDPYAVRAAELWFRHQKVALQDGVLLADGERLRRRNPQTMKLLQSLIAKAEREAVGAGAARPGAAQTAPETLDMLNRDTAQRYWQTALTDQGSELVLGLNLDRSGRASPGLAALCRVLAAWVEHFHRCRLRFTPLTNIDDPHWRWHIGLDSTSNRLLNRLYRGEALSDAERRSLLMLFRLEFVDPEESSVPLRPQLRGYPIYLGLAMNDAEELRMKPQNLLCNLPLAAVN